MSTRVTNTPTPAPVTGEPSRIELPSGLYIAPTNEPTVWWLYAVNGAGICQLNYIRAEQVQEFAAAMNRGSAQGDGLAITHQQALEKIDAERLRQMEVEGWTPEHDSEHTNAEMFRAAQSYYFNAVGGILGMDGTTRIPVGSPPSSWPWDDAWWKPKTPLRDLVRAGALVKAEKSRLQRAHGKSFQTPTCDHWLEKIAKAICALAATPSTGWRPIDETTPKTGVEMWVLFDDGTRRLIQADDHTDWKAPGSKKDWLRQPTFYLPVSLPTPPVQADALSETKPFAVEE